jgi:hypothetical protein
MASIHEALLILSWTTTYPDVLADGGKLTTKAGYKTVQSEQTSLDWPWRDDDEPHWSRFWSRYIGSPARTRGISLNAAWARVVPYRMWPATDIPGPGESHGRAHVLVYPHAISVVVSVDAVGPWPVAEFARGIADLRAAHTWGAKHNRTLDGIATDLCARAAPLLRDRPGEPSFPTVRSVVAPTRGDGAESDLSVDDPTVRSCLAGLASIGPPGEFDPARLLAANSDARRAGRVYFRKDGHVVWHPRHVITPPPSDSVGCLVRNQADLVTHIAALGDAIGWGADRVPRIPEHVQPLLDSAATRLRILYEGNENKTYRSELAEIRIKPLLPAVDTVEAAI